LSYSLKVTNCVTFYGKYWVTLLELRWEGRKASKERKWGCTN